jgi:hypothetical protein
MFFEKCPIIVVSEPDIQAALAHLRQQPHRKGLPQAWDRQHFISLLKQAVGNRPKADQAFAVAPGVFGIIKPFGVDLVGQLEPDGRLQVWLAVRSVGTDPDRVTEL